MVDISNNGKKELDELDIFILILDILVSEMIRKAQTTSQNTPKPTPFRHLDDIQHLWEVLPSVRAPQMRRGDPGETETFIASHGTGRTQHSKIIGIYQHDFTYHRGIFHYLLVKSGQ